MKFTIYLSEENKKKLEYEVISTDLRVFLTRKLEKEIREHKSSEHYLIYINKMINRPRTIAGRKIYVLEPDDWGHFEACEYAWHYGEFELIFRRLDTPEFIEFLCELIEQEWFKIKEINQLLKKDGASCRVTKSSGNIGIEVFSIDEIESEPQEDTHPNIRLLVKRMEDNLASKDFAGVLHSSASIFETLAKDIISLPTIENKTLKSFFDRYRKDSKLPNELLDYILHIYESRNITPLAGHGATNAPNITKEEAVTLSEMTKAFVRIEYSLQL